MRKFGIKYARLHPQSQQVRDAFVAVTQPAAGQAALDRWYAEACRASSPRRRRKGFTVRRGTEEVVGNVFSIVVIVIPTTSSVPFRLPTVLFAAPFPRIIIEWHYLRCVTSV